MVKRFSMLALAGLIALPALASASAGPNPNDLERKIEELSLQLDQLKASMAKQAENNVTQAAFADLSDTVDGLDERSEAWDLSSRFTFNGDFRSRLDSLDATSASAYSAGDVAAGMAMALAAPVDMGGFGAPGPYDLASFQAAMAGFSSYTAAQRAGMFADMGVLPTAAADYNNDTVFTNRFRLNMRVAATENVEFKGRLAMYKAWGMQSNPTADAGGPYTMDSFSWDGNMSRQPGDSALLVDRAFLNWNNIAGQPMWFSIGRRPTTDGPPAHIRMGSDTRLATPVSVMDYPFDGISMGYAYRWANEDMGTGRIRFCYGRGFDAGIETDGTGLNDMDFAGLSWDVLKKGDRFLNIQSFMAYNLVNTPDGVTFANPFEVAYVIDPTTGTESAIFAGDGILDKANLGDIMHTSAVYHDKIGNINYYGSAAWSRTMPDGYDEVGNSLLGSWWAPEEDQDGYMIQIGARYDMDDLGLKLGAEYNQGSEYWVSMSPGHDDLYNSKLATRGNVVELYGIYDLPGAAVSKFGSAFIRFGYQHYEYDFTGSGSWLGAPVDLDDLASDPFNAQFFAPIESQDQFYVTFEATF